MAVFGLSKIKPNNTAERIGIHAGLISQPPMVRFHPPHPILRGRLVIVGGRRWYVKRGSSPQARRFDSGQRMVQHHT